MTGTVFQHWKTSYGFTRNSVSYDFLDVDTVTLEIVEAKHLTRGANSKNKRGVVYKESSKTPSTATVSVLNLPGDIRDILTECYENEERINFYIVDEKTGKSITFADSIISQPPLEEQIGDGDVYNMDLVFESFNIRKKIYDDATE